MKAILCTMALALTCASAFAQATAAAATAKPVAAPAASATSAKAIAKPGGAPAAGGNGGGVSTNGSNLSTQVGPKKPKCPDPTVACPAEKVISK